MYSYYRKPWEIPRGVDPGFTPSGARLPIEDAIVEPQVGRCIHHPVLPVVAAGENVPSVGNAALEEILM